jgi:predicted RNA binding protein YcfA (HicA-like mRNA interferase family)
MPPFIRGVAFADALTRFKLVGWREDIQEGSHLRLVHPKFPGISISLPDHRRHDLDPLTLGRAVEIAGLTGEQFSRLTGSGHRQHARRIRQGVYGMES